MSRTVSARISKDTHDELRDTPKDKDDQKEGWFTANSDDAEIHLVAIDGTFRQLFFKKDSVMRIVGNVIWFNADYTDYLITDHSKKFPENKRIDK